MEGETGDVLRRDSLLKRILLICGIMIFLGGTGLALYLTFAASILTSGPTRCYGCAIAYDLTLSASSSVISESDTVVVTATIQAETPVSIHLTAPGFDPSTTEPKHLVPISIDEGGGTFLRTIQPNKLSWVLTPAKIGTSQAVVEMDDISGNVLLTKYVGITVTNIFGLKLWTIQLFSSIAAFLGPILTAPWWYDRWKERKQERRTSTPPRPKRRGRRRR